MPLLCQLKFGPEGVRSEGSIGVPECWSVVFGGHVPEGRKMVARHEMPASGVAGLTPMMNGAFGGWSRRGGGTGWRGGGFGLWGRCVLL